MSKSANIILAEYKTNHTLYNDFSYVMYNLLEDMLKKDKYKYHINNRLKDLTSLSEKIKRKEIIGVRYKHIEDIEDIVGIRVVFFTEMDKKQFIRSMRKDFGESMKIEKASGKYGYTSTHVIASLGKKRSSLVEYKRFKELKCEIQLTLILNHAWSEVEHDILYKEGTGVSQMNQEQYDNLKDRMKKIMSEYIMRASSELESIAKEVKKLEAVK